MNTLEYFYGDYGDVEPRFLAALDESLKPHGPDMLYDTVASLPLREGAQVVDLGCGAGQYSLELARRFGFDVLGIDPAPRHIDDATAASAGSEVAARVRFVSGRAEKLMLADATIDLVWCRDVLVHVGHLDRAFAECRRILRPTGYMVVLHPQATPRMSPDEAAWLWSTMHVVPATTDVTVFEAAFTRAGFEAEQRLDVGTEWREYREETTGQSRLLHAARLLREPDRYIAQFGQAAYDIMLGDCYWHIYQLLGKFSYRIYVLRCAR